MCRDRARLVISSVSECGGFPKGEMLSDLCPVAFHRASLASHIGHTRAAVKLQLMSNIVHNGPGNVVLGDEENALHIEST